MGSIFSVLIPLILRHKGKLRWWLIGKLVSMSFRFIFGNKQRRARIKLKYGGRPKQQRFPR